MILRVRFKRNALVVLDSSVANLSIKKSLNQSGEWNFSIPRNTVKELEIENGDYVEIFLENVVLMEGYVSDLTLSASDSTTYEIQGRDQTDLLFTKRSWNRALFKDTTIALALCELLYFNGWRLNDVSTFEEFLSNISVDLRSEESLMSQVRKILDINPGISFRYAGEHAGFPSLDIGAFNENQNIYVTNAPETQLARDYNTIGIQDISVSKSLDLYGKIEAYGGEVTETAGKRQISLKDALLSQPLLAWDYDNYRILEEESGRSYIVINDDLVEGGLVNCYGDGGTSAVIIGRNNGTGAQNFSHKWAFAIPTYTGWLKRITFKFSTNVGAPTDLEVSIREHNPVTGPSSTKLYTKYYANAAVLASSTTVIDLEVGELYLEKGKNYCIVFTQPTEPPLANRYNRLEATTVEPKSPAIYSWVSNAIGGVENWLQGVNGSGIGTVTPHISIETYTPETQISYLALAKKWTEYAPENTNTNATVTDIRKAAVSLLTRARALLRDKSQLHRKINISAVGDADFISIGDKVYVNFNNTTGFYDAVANQTTVLFDTIQEWLRCFSVSLSYNDNGLAWSLQLTDSPLITEEEFFVSVYDLTKDKEALKGARPAYLLEPTLVTPTATIVAGTDANTTYKGVDALEIAVPIPAAPSVYAKALALMTSPLMSNMSHENIKAEVLQDFEYRDGQQAKIVFYSDIGWKSYFSTDYKLFILWV